MYSDMDVIPITETILPPDYKNKILMQEDAEAMRRERQREVEDMYYEYLPNDETRW